MGVDLLNLKQKAASTTALLNGRKREMQRLTETMKATKSDINFKVDTTGRLKEECKRVIEEVELAKHNLAKLTKKMHNYDVPAPEEYIKTKSGLDELRQCIKTWQRKVEISEMNLRSVSTQWRKLCAKQKAASGDSCNSQLCPLDPRAPRALHSPTENSVC